MEEHFLVGDGRWAGVISPLCPCSQEFKSWQAWLRHQTKLSKVQVQVPHDRRIGCPGVLWNPVRRIFELLHKPLSGVTVSVADAALGQRDGLADLSRSFPAHVVVMERKVQLLMMRVTEWVDSRRNAWWMVPYLVPLLFSLLADFQYSVIIYLIAVLYSATIVLFVLYNQRENVTFFIFPVSLGVMFYFPR